MIQQSWLVEKSGSGPEPMELQEPWYHFRAKVAGTGVDKFSAVTQALHGTDATALLTTPQYLPPANAFVVQINGVITTQSYTSLTYSANDDIIIARNPSYADDTLFPMISFGEDVGEVTSPLPPMSVDGTNPVTSIVSYKSKKALPKSSAPSSSRTFIAAGVFAGANSLGLRYTAGIACEDLFRYNPQIYDFRYAFSGMLNYQVTFPSRLFTYVDHVTLIDCIFHTSFGSSSLPFADAHVFDGIEDVSTAYGILAYMRGGNILVSGMFGALSHVTDFSYFAYGSRIATIPDGLLRNCSSGTNFTNAFSHCDYLTHIGAHILPESAQICTELFGDSRGSMTVDPLAFDGCSNIYMLNGPFKDCTGLTELPDGLFASCGNTVTNIQYLAGKCTSLARIGDGLFGTGFRTGNYLKTMYGAFLSCAITTIPSDLFSVFKGMDPSTNSLLTMYWVFGSCTHLKSIPSGFFASFDKLPSQLANADLEFFYNCPSIESVGSDFLGHCGQSGVKMFADCPLLTDVVIDVMLDDSYTGNRMVEGFTENPDAHRVLRVPAEYADRIQDATPENLAKYGVTIELI